MNWKYILIGSIILNVILGVGIIRELNISNHTSTEKIDQLIVEAKDVSARNSRYDYSYIESSLWRIGITEGVQPVFWKIRRQRENVNDYIDNLILEIEKIKDKEGEIYLEKRVEPYNILNKNNGLDKIEKELNIRMDSLIFYFDKSVNLLHEHSIGELFFNDKKIKKALTSLDINAKINSLKNISLLETRLVLHSIQLDFQNIFSVYIEAIREMLPLDERYKFDQLKVVVNPKSNTVKLGEKYEAELAVVKYLSNPSGNTSISVNGKEYRIGEDGFVHYQIKGDKIGEHELKIKASILNPLSRERRNSSSTFAYKVLP